VRFFLFIITFTSIYASMHLYAFLKLRRAVALSGISIALIAVFMILMILTPIIVRVVESADFERTAKVFATVGYTWMGFLFLFFAASFTLDVWRFLVYAAEGLLKASLEALKLSARQAFFLPFFASVLAAGYGLFEATNIRTETVVIKSAKITKPIRIAQISDVHLGILIREGRLEKILEKVKAASPDIFVSTGDLVDGQTDSLNGVGNLLREIKAPLGKYAITGNHEFYAGLDRSLEFMKQAGFHVLRGEGTSVAGLITIAGVDDPVVRGYGGSRDREVPEKELLSGLPKDKFTLFLKHRPDVDQSAVGLFDLQLSGHAHKGQIFPWTLLVRLVHPHIAGLYDLASGSSLYVSRGSGTWGPPIRFLSPPEVTVIDLVPEKSAQGPRLPISTETQIYWVATGDAR
jgi:predicted MPP superfamily phosphohydrolase